MTDMTTSLPLAARKNGGNTRAIINCTAGGEVKAVEPRKGNHAYTGIGWAMTPSAWAMLWAKGGRNTPTSVMMA
jgi:hypothetical protein